MQSKYTKELLKWQNKSLSQYSNLLYKQHIILGNLGMLNGKDALHELHFAINNAIDASKYLRAINILCRMADVRRHPNAFYDHLSYEFLSAKNIHNRIRHYLNKNLFNKFKNQKA